MIGFLSGMIIFSDGIEAIVQTAGGQGFQVYFSKVLIEGQTASMFIAHVIREDAETLFGFSSLRSKKLFEMLLSVKGIGPKSAYGLISTLSVDEIINAIKTENKSILTKVSGLGNKGASQIILDLSSKIDRVKMYSAELVTNSTILNGNFSKEISHSQIGLQIIGHEGQGLLNSSALANAQANSLELIGQEDGSSAKNAVKFNLQNILEDTILACKELGFREEKIIPMAKRILSENQISRPEQLVHLVLREM
jgi:holliday junction DNA helicase RuvA